MILWGFVCNLYCSYFIKKGSLNYYKNALFIIVYNLYSFVVILVNKICSWSLSNDSQILPFNTWTFQRKLFVLIFPSIFSLSLGCSVLRYCDHFSRLSILNHHVWVSETPPANCVYIKLKSNSVVFVHAWDASDKSRSQWSCR